jgi:hypothetical protein
VTITVTSQNASVPFSTTVTTSQGRYVVANAPADTLLQVTTTKAGYSTRVQYFTVASNSTGTQVLNFGKDLNNANDQVGNPYFITNYPEITSVSPADGASGVDPTKVNVVVTLSAALDSDSKNRFVRALRLLPANQYADPTQVTTAGSASDMAADASNGGQTQQTTGDAVVTAYGTNTAGQVASTTVTPTANVPFNTGDYAIYAGVPFHLAG